jgi:phosphoglycolate phosphatase
MSADSYMKGIINLVWDWNGTLLDDMDICIGSMNRMLARRNLPPLTRDRYRSIFTFPVRKYYAEAGFDFETESFDVVGLEFIELYYREVHRATIFSEAPEVLGGLRACGYRQYLLSAMETGSLQRLVKQQGVTQYFERITGIGDHYADGKLHAAKELFAVTGLDPAGTCLIGDTLHDREVAAETGCRCVLVAHGHQSRERLNESDVPVAGSLTEVRGMFGKEAVR